jgi:hypothetical protein
LELIGDEAAARALECADDLATVPMTRRMPRRGMLPIGLPRAASICCVVGLNDPAPSADFDTMPAEKSVVRRPANGGYSQSCNQKLPVCTRPSFSHYAVHSGRTPDVGF